MADPAPRIPWVMILAAGAAAIAVLASIYLLQPKPPAETETETASANAPVGCVLSPGKQIGGPIDLIDESGAAVTQKHFNEGMSLVYFGYTFCPDVCPTTLNAVADALDKLGPAAARVRPVFITVDPKRDTPAVVKQYAAAFGPAITGLTGTPEQIAQVARAYRVYYAEHRTGPGPNDYSMDHSSILYLMGPDGAFIAPIRADQSGDEMAASLKKLMG